MTILAWTLVGILLVVVVVLVVIIGVLHGAVEDVLKGLWR